MLKRARKVPAVGPVVTGVARAFRQKRARIHSVVSTQTVRKGIPPWSLLVLLVLGASVGFYASTIVGAATGQKAPTNPDFTIGSNPGSLTVPQGQVASYSLAMDSLNGFAGSVNLNVSAKPAIANATLALNPASVSLFTGSATASLTIPIPASTPVSDYLLTVSASSGKLIHTVILILQIVPPPAPDFTIQAGQSAINVTRGSSGSATVTLTSVGGFSGLVNMTSSISPGGGSSPSLSLNPVRVTLLSGGTASVLLTITTSLSTTRGSYSVTVQGVSGSLSNTATIQLMIQ
jgi:uncharacterized membrane protein